jgi:hypothetical protein
MGAATGFIVKLASESKFHVVGIEMSKFAAEFGILLG